MVTFTSDEHGIETCQVPKYVISSINIAKLILHQVNLLDSEIVTLTC